MVSYSQSSKDVLGHSTVAHTKLYHAACTYTLARLPALQAAPNVRHIQGEPQIRIVDLRVQVTKCIIWLSNQDLLN